jgi:hypothetical protein
MIRGAYPGVGPWEWEVHPEWHSRVQATLLAEIEGAQIRARTQAEEE